MADEPQSCEWSPVFRVQAFLRHLNKFCSPWPHPNPQKLDLFNLPLHQYSQLILYRLISLFIRCIKLLKLSLLRCTAEWFNSSTGYAELPARVAPLCHRAMPPQYCWPHSLCGRSKATHSCNGYIYCYCLGKPSFEKFQPIQKQNCMNHVYMHILSNVGNWLHGYLERELV